MHLKRTTDFMINGNPLPVPDADPEISYEDIDSDDSGRTLDAVMHREVIREGVAHWPFCWGTISAEDYAYVESLFRGNSEFNFTFPSDTGPKTIRAYRAKYSITLHNVRTGDWRNYKFNIVEC